MTDQLMLTIHFFKDDLERSTNEAAGILLMSMSREFKQDMNTIMFHIFRNLSGHARRRCILSFGIRENM